MLQHIMYLMFGLIFWHAVLLNFNVSIYFSTINISQQFLSFYNVFSAFGRNGLKKTKRERERENDNQWQHLQQRHNALVVTHYISGDRKYQRKHMEHSDKPTVTTLQQRVATKAVSGNNQTFQWRRPSLVKVAILVVPFFFVKLTILNSVRLLAEEVLVFLIS